MPYGVKKLVWKSFQKTQLLSHEAMETVILAVDILPMLSWNCKELGISVQVK